MHITCCWCLSKKYDSEIESKGQLSFSQGRCARLCGWFEKLFKVLHLSRQTKRGKRQELSTARDLFMLFWGFFWLSETKRLCDRYQNFLAAKLVVWNGPFEVVCRIKWQFVHLAKLKVLAYWIQFRGQNAGLLSLEIEPGSVWKLRGGDKPQLLELIPALPGGLNIIINEDDWIANLKVCRQQRAVDP